MAESCPHENISVDQAWKNGECVESHIRCDDCNTQLK